MTTMQEWTFCGHWEGSRLAIDFVCEGSVPDDRPIDDAEYPDGLWADSARSDTITAALQSLIDPVRGRLPRASRAGTSRESGSPRSGSRRCRTGGM